MPNQVHVQPDFRADELASVEKLCGSLDQTLENPTSLGTPIGACSPLEEIGSRLWSASGLNAESMLGAIDQAREDEAALPVIVEGEHQHLPWELLYHPHDDLGFLGRHPWLAVVRRIAAARKPRKPRALPLRILLFTSSPEDLDPVTGRLDYEREEELLFTALDRSLANSEVMVDVAEDGLLETLIDRLDSQHYHAVILSMHGTRTGTGEDTEWGLLFEDPRTWQSRPVAGSELARRLDLLTARNRPDLLVLSACRSARAEQAIQAIPSVAAQLNRKGFDRVLGMRHSVLDRAASAFNAEFFRRLTQGEDLGRALSLARHQVSTGRWLCTAAEPQHPAPSGDPYAQWTLPVLFDRSSGPLIDRELDQLVVKRPLQESVLVGDGSLTLPQRSEFIGRRRIFRQHLRPFLKGQRHQLLFTGAGGVGKTTLAGQFVRRLCDREPQTRRLGFQAPFDLKTVYEALFQEATHGNEDPQLLPKIQLEQDRRQSIVHMLHSLARRPERPLLILLDNLESIQSLNTLEITPEGQDGWWLVQQVCLLPAPTRILLTGRYAMPGLPQSVQHCPVPDAPLGDILRRMNRLEWPVEFTVDEKRSVYQTLGGNHRAIEWMAALLKGEQIQAPELLKELTRLKAPPETPQQAGEAVLEALRHNLLLGRLRKQLTPSQDRLLQACCLFRVPVTSDGLLVVESHPAEHQASRQRLLDFSLLETSFQPIVDLDYFAVPAVVRGLIGKGLGIDSSELLKLHCRIGQYHAFQATHVSRVLGEALEAIHHLRQADEHQQGDHLTEGVTGTYFQHSNFSEASRLAAEVIERDQASAPWWALVRFGMCQDVLGDRTAALQAYERALPRSPSSKEQATTLHKVGQVHLARGDYSTALEYLEESLGICRTIACRDGETAVLNDIGRVQMSQGNYRLALKRFQQCLRGMGETNYRSMGGVLNNISLVYEYLGNYQKALDCAQRSLKIFGDTGDKQGAGTALNSIGLLYNTLESNELALESLVKSLRIRRQIRDKEGEGATLHNIGLVYMSERKYPRALDFLQQSLEVSRLINDKAGEGRTLSLIGEIYCAKGRTEEGLRHLAQSLKIHREIGDRAGESITLSRIANVQNASGEYTNALETLKETVDLCRLTDDLDGEITALYNMGWAALRAGNEPHALSYWTEALQLAQQTDNTEGIFRVASALGRHFINSGNQDHGRPLLQIAIQAGEKGGFSGVEKLRELLDQA